MQHEYAAEHMFVGGIIPASPTHVACAYVHRDKRALAHRKKKCAMIRDRDCGTVALAWYSGVQLH